MIGRLRARWKAFLTWAHGVAEWWSNSRPGRAWSHYSRSGGSLLSGGLAYSALFSLFAALTIGATLLTGLIGSNQRLSDAILKTLDSWIPGIIGDGTGNEPLNINDLKMPSGLGLTSIIAGVVLLFSALSFMGAMRHGLRTMFGEVDVKQNPVTSKIRDLAGFLALGVSIVLSSAATLLVSGAARWVADITGWDLGFWGGLAVRIISGVAVLCVDAITMMVLFVGLGQARPRRRDLVIGALVAAVALSVVRYAGAGVIAAGKSSNALLGSFSVIVTLLVWINLLGRIILIAAAWTADPPRPPDLPAPPPVLGPAEEDLRETLRRKREERAEAPAST